MRRIGVLATTFVALYIATAFICADWYWVQTILENKEAVMVRFWIACLFGAGLAMAWIFSDD